MENQQQYVQNSPPQNGLQHLDPKAVWLFFIPSAFVFLFVAIWFLAALYNTPDAMSAALVIAGRIIIIVALVLAFIWAKLEYRYYLFELREDGFRKELGVIRKKYVTIPYD